MSLSPLPSPLRYNAEDRLEFDGCEIEELARRFATPLYVYSAQSIRTRLEAFQNALRGRRSLICYSVKANSNLSILRLIHRAGCGMDIVSGGELHRALKAGVPAGQIVFSGVGKSAEEIKAALKQNILLFGVESEEELRLIDAIARESGCIARVGIRINPNVDAGTHPYISTGRLQDKFGLTVRQAQAIYRQRELFRGLNICGIGFHIGSQLTRLPVFRKAARKIANLFRELAGEGVSLKYIQVGGGLGISYDRERPPSVAEYVSEIYRDIPFQDPTLIFEPGRYVAGNAGILITRLLYCKRHLRRHIYVADGAMNDLLRPAFYGSHHQILPSRRRKGKLVNADLVGPICESGDFLARNRRMAPCSQGDYLVLRSAGAYGFVMSSNYNSRPRAAEVLVDADIAGSQANPKIALIRRRESCEDLTRLEEQL